MDYFGVIQNFYSGNYAQVLQEIEKVGGPSDDTLLFYEFKTEIALGTYHPKSTTSKLSHAADLYYQFLTSRDTSDIEAKTNLNSSTPYELNFLATAQAIAGKLEESLQTCVHGIDGDETIGVTELVLLAIQVALLSGQPQVALTIYNNYNASIEETRSSESEIMMNLAESYIKFATNVGTRTSNFYYFEELSHSLPSWSTQLGLLNLHLQQGNIEESRGIVDLLESDYYSVGQKKEAQLFAAHFLANKITLALMEGTGDVDALRSEIRELDPDHEFVKNEMDANAKFDELVATFENE